MLCYVLLNLCSSRVSQISKQLETVCNFHRIFILFFLAAKVNAQYNVYTLFNILCTFPYHFRNINSLSGHVVTSVFLLIIFCLSFKGEPQVKTLCYPVHSSPQCWVIVLRVQTAVRFPPCNNENSNNYVTGKFLPHSAARFVPD